MRYRVHQIALPYYGSQERLPHLVARRLGVPLDQLGELRVLRRSLDARGRVRAPRFVLSVEVELERGLEGALPAGVEVVPEAGEEPKLPRVRRRAAELRPLVVGAGPAGLMAALELAEAGLEPLLVERGGPVEERGAEVGRFWDRGELDAESNVLFGEGGAGLFSDGKLTARSKDRRRVRRFLEVLVSCGAPDSVLVDAEPHLGSDRLQEILPALRRRIQKAGGRIRTRTRLDGLHVEGGRLRGVLVAGEELRVDRCVLATGHSARDVWFMLAGAGAPLEAKPFALGLRLELPQAAVDRARFGRWAGDVRLGAAGFRLTRKADGDARACYSFCMCPGGSVIACASEPGGLTTNGMSLSRRTGAWANAAFLVPVVPADFPLDGATPALAGVRLQAGLEERALRAGGGDYSLPASTLEAFLAGREPGELPAERSCPRARPAKLNPLLPTEVTRTLLRSIPAMLYELAGCDPGEVLLYGVETRSSSPVRTPRDERMESTGIRGLFPVGEGAGYAGGIVSSAVDGARAAAALLAARGGEPCR